MALEPAKLSDFALAGALGAGSTARVYDAIHTPSGRVVAIKMLEPSQQDAETRERFAREALFLSGVKSRHIGKVIGFGFDRGQPFLVLERLRGETLDAKLRRDGPVPIAQALGWIEQLVVGVRDCHDANIIHRDIKPSNIFLHQEHGFDEIVKVIDFGVARLKEVAGDPGGLTSSQALIGSMGYMAPEQFRDAKSVDFTADLYAVGVVVFRALTGRLPFVSRSLDAVIRMKLEHEVPLVSSMPDMPRNALLDVFVRRAMERRPEDRFKSAREMLGGWWNVMSSFGQDASTDATRGLGQVDESYAGPRPGAHRLRQPPPPMPPTLVPWAEPAEDDRTLLRAPVPPPRPHEPASGSVRAAARATRDTLPPSSERTLLEPAPKTLPGPPPPSGPSRPPSPALPWTLPGEVVLPPEAYPSLSLSQGEAAAAAPPDPLWDMPTRTDPSLRELVERELELQRRAKSRG